MTKLEEVLAEEWEVVGGPDPDGDICDASKGNPDSDRIVMSAFGVQSRLMTRAAVAVLGKRALALVLKHEWCGWNGEGYDPGGDRCPECEEWADYDRAIPGDMTSPIVARGKHKPGCEWGAIVAAAKEIG